MRTTVDLPDSLVRAAKVRAAASDETLKDLFTRALSRELGRTSRQRGELPLIATERRGTVDLSPGDLDSALADEDAARLA